MGVRACLGSEVILELALWEKGMIHANGQVLLKRASGSTKGSLGRLLMQPFSVVSKWFWGAWVAQSVGHLTSAQVMISPLTRSSLTSGSVLTAQSLEPAPSSVSPSLSAPPPFMLSLSLKNKHFKKWFCHNMKTFFKSLFYSLSPKYLIIFCTHTHTHTHTYI